LTREHTHFFCAGAPVVGLINEVARPMRPPQLAPSSLNAFSAFVIDYRCCPDGQLLQPSGQPFELLICAEFLQAVNADLNRLGVVVSDIVDVFGVTHFDRLPLRCRLRNQ
jgi:hypothetical protein